MIRLSNIRVPPAERLALLLRAQHLRFEREFIFAPGRQYRADFRLGRVLVEVEGGMWVPGGGRHQRGAGFSRDVEKYELARSLGYEVIRLTPEAIDSGKGLEWIAAALARVSKGTI
jgi:very-short-patch-repair endonuclease